MNKIIDGIEIYKGTICNINAINSILKLYNKDLSEDLFLGLGPGLEFRIGQLKNSKVEINCFDLFLDCNSLKDLLVCCGIELSDKVFVTVDDLIDNIKCEISEGRPVLILVDSKHLEYWPSQLRINSGHYLVCYGWDDTKNEVFIMDNLIPSRPTQYYKGAISVDTLKTALDCRFTLYSSQHYCWNFRDTGIEKNITKDHIKNTIKSSIYNMCEKNNMYTNIDGEEIEFKCGLIGQRHLSSMLDSIAKKGINDEYSELLVDIFSLLSSFGGPSPTRQIYANFLEKIRSDYDLCISEEMIISFKNISDQWKIIANVILRSVHENDVSSLSRAIERLNKVIDMEDNCILSLNTII